MSFTAVCRQIEHFCLSLQSCMQLRDLRDHQHSWLCNLPEYSQALLLPNSSSFFSRDGSLCIVTAPVRISPCPKHTKLLFSTVFHFSDFTICCSDWENFNYFSLSTRILYFFGLFPEQMASAEAWRSLMVSVKVIWNSHNTLSQSVGCYSSSILETWILCPPHIQSPFYWKNMWSYTRS